MKKEPLIFIEHILENIKDIEQFSKGLSKSGLEKNKLKQKAIVRSIEIIGEAVKNLPDSLKNKYQNISWKQIAGTRDRIIHHYFGVDLDIVWGILKKDLAELKKEILKIKEDLEKN